MKYNNVEFDAIVATPGCGKSYLCDKYPNLFVDVDEEGLRCKYVVPENITREELEKTKGARTFPRRAHHEEYVRELYKKLDNFLKEGKILIAAPHSETIDYLINHNLKFCFVYPSFDMKDEIVRRLKMRGNPEETVKSNEEMFFEYYNSNVKESKSILHYEFKKDEYLEDIIQKFGIKLSPNTQNKEK